MPDNVVKLFERLVEVLLSNFERDPAQKPPNPETDAAKRYQQLFLNKSKACLEKVSRFLGLFEFMFMRDLVVID